MSRQLRLLVLLAALLLPGGGAAAQAGDTTQVARLRALLLSRSPALAAFRSSAAAAEARAGAAGFAGPALLSFEAEEVPDGFDLPDAGSLRLDLSREFLTGGRGSARRGVTAAESEAALASLQAAERRVAAEVDHMLQRAMGERVVARLLAAEDDRLALAEEALRVRFSVGEVRYSDVLRLRTERLRVQAEGATSAVEARLARQELLALGGLAPGVTGTPDSVTALADSVLAGSALEYFERPLPPAPPIDSLISQAAVVREADAALTRAEALAALQGAERRPRLAGGIGIQRFGTGGGDFEIGPTLGLALTLPFTAGRANRLATEAWERQVAATRAHRDAVMLGLRTEVAATRERYEALRERLVRYDRALLRGAREERESAFAAYRSGELPLIAYLDFERALSESEVLIVRSRTDAAAAFVTLMNGTAGAGLEVPSAPEAIP